MTHSSTVQTIVKRSATTQAATDDKNFQFGQITYMGRVSDSEMIWQYGTFGSAPIDSLCITLSSSAQEENRVTFPSNTPKRIRRKLQPGEVGFGNFLTKSQMFYNKDGDIEIISERDLKITVKRNGIVEIDGDATITIKKKLTETVDDDVTQEYKKNLNTTVDQNVTITSDNGEITFKSDMIKLDGDVTITGDLQVDGKTTLGPGGQPIARQGDPVSTGGFISAGSPNNTSN